MRSRKYEYDLFNSEKVQTIRVFDWPPYLVYRVWDSDLSTWIYVDESYPGAEYASGEVASQISTGVYLDSIDLKQYETKISFSTPGWGTVLLRNTATYIPRSIKDVGKYFKAPIPPTFRPSRFRFPKRPTQPPVLVPKPNKFGHVTQRTAKRFESINALRLRRYQVQVLRYERLLALYNSSQKKAQERYELRRFKYEKLLARYKHRLDLLKTWRAPREVRKQRKFDFVDNYHLRLSFEKVDSGASPTSYYYDTVGGTSPHVLNMISYVKGVSGDVTDSDIDLIADSMKDYVRAALSSEREILDAKLARKFYSKLSRSKINVSIMIAERAQTLNLFLSSVKRLSELITLKRNLFKNLGRYLLNPKKISSDFLAFQFGVLPLINDVYGSAQLLAEATVDTDQALVVVRTNSKVSINLIRDDIEIRGFLTRSYVFKYKVDELALSKLSSMGLVNPATVAWEVLPFSFVVDWALPVSTYIESLTADCGLEFETGTISEKFTGTVTFAPTQYLTIPLKDGQVRVLPEGTFNFRYYEREVASPPDRFNILSMKSPLSLTHGLEALALIVQRAFK